LKGSLWFLPVPGRGEGDSRQGGGGLQQFGGTVLKSSLSKEAEKELQDALHGETATA
jgi:hypothetical protein